LSEVAAAAALGGARPSAEAAATPGRTSSDAITAERCNAVFRDANFDRVRVRARMKPKSPLTRAANPPVFYTHALPG